MAKTDAVLINNDRPRRIWPLLVIALVAGFYFQSMILLSKVPLLSDIRSYYYPAWTYFSHALRSGSVPFWCPGIYCGFPLIADSEMGLFYPLNLLLFRLPTTAGFNYSLVLHYLLGGWFTYAYCRRLRLSRSASLFAAVPFVMGGFLLSHMVHPNVVATAAWMPLFLYCLEGALGERRMSFFAAAGGVLGLQFLSGFLMIPLMEVILSFFYVLFYPRRPGESRGGYLLFSLGGLALAVGLGTGLGMVQNLPSYQLVQNSYRAGGLNEQVSNMGNLPPAQLAGLVFPRAFGRGVAMGGYYGAWTFEETYGYIGLLPLLFAPAALLRPRRWHAVLFTWVAAVSLLLSLGNQGLLWPLLHALPGFSVLKGASRFLLTLNLAVAVLGGIGFDRWRKAEFPARLKDSLTRFWAIVFIAAGSIIVVLTLLYHFNPLNFQDFLAAVLRPFFSGIKHSAQQILGALDDYFTSPRLEFLFPLLMLGVFLFLIRSGREKDRPGRGKVALAVLIAIVDVFLFSSFIYGFVPRAKVERRPMVLDVLQEEVGRGRVALLKEPGVNRGEFPLCSNQLLPEGLEDAFGFSTIPPSRLDRFLALLNQQPSIHAFELLGVTTLFSDLVRVDGLPYDLGEPFRISTGLDVKRYVYPDIVGEQLRLLLDGTIMDPDASGSLYLGISASGPEGLQLLSELRLDKESGDGGYGLEVISGNPAAFVHHVSFRSPGYGQGRRTLEIRVPVDRIWDAEEVVVTTICDRYLDETRLLAMNVVDRRGDGLPLTALPIVYLDREQAVYHTPDPLPRAYFAWEPAWAETWRKAVDAAWRGEGRDGRVILLGDEIDTATRQMIDRLGPPGREANITHLEEGKDALTLRSSNDSDAVLVLSIDYLPGWNARVDGAETPVFSADGFLSAIYLPAGDHEVELTYRQPGLVVGGWISAVSLIALALLYVVFRKREKAAAGPEGVAGAPPEPPPDPGGISAFFPCYNDSATVSQLVDKALKVLSELTSDYEVIIVDDGSEDDSGAIADALSARYPRVRVIHHERNRGYGAALRSGISSSTKKWIFYTDSDGQYDVEDLRLLHAYSGEAAVINGYKTGRRDPWYRVFLGSTYNFLIHRMFAIPIRDVDCDFRLMKGELARSLDLRSEGGAICVELVKGLQTAGATFAETPVAHHPRQVGRSQFFRPKNLVVMVGELLSLWWRIVIIREV
jgi:hypothetical protein